MPYMTWYLNRVRFRAAWATSDLVGFSTLDWCRGIATLSSGGRSSIACLGKKVGLESFSFPVYSEEKAASGSVSILILCITCDTDSPAAAALPPGEATGSLSAGDRVLIQVVPQCTALAGGLANPRRRRSLLVVLPEGLLGLLLDSRRRNC